MTARSGGERAEAVKEAKPLLHTIAPVYDARSRILILGSFPSVKSREAAFFYGNPQNRFWRVLAELYDSDVPGSVDEKKRLLLDNGVAVWDVIASCEIRGSDDASIAGVTPNDLTAIFKTARIERVFTNGGKAHALYKKYLEPRTGLAAAALPSTSPANAAYSLERLVLSWSRILEQAER